MPCGCLPRSDATFSLRTRLIAGVVVLIAAALGAAAAGIYSEQRSYLNGQLDQRVIAAAAPISYQLGLDAGLFRRSVSVRDQDGHRRPLPICEEPQWFLPSGTYGELIRPDGELLRGPSWSTTETTPSPHGACPSTYEARVPEVARC